MIPPMLRARNTLPLFLCVPLLAIAAGDSARQRAFELYEAGKFNEARVVLEQLDARDEADGIAMYRLFYCRQLIQDPNTQQTLEKARGLLEQAVQTSGDLETYFYLTNAYVNLSRGDDARRVAVEATRKVEEGELSTPSTPLDMFRLGKLYADQEREIEAVQWYGRSADGFEAADSVARRPYVQWASRYLAERAFEGKRYEEAAKQFGRVLGNGSGSFEDWDRFALSQAWIGRYEGAALAWRRGLSLGPGGSDRAHYGAGVAERAARTANVPDAAPDGRAWEELDQAELEGILLEQAAVVREALSWMLNAGHRIHFVERMALQQQIDEARPVFVAAALEFVLRDYSLREKSFSGGYAGLILRERAWQVSPRP